MLFMLPETEHRSLEDIELHFSDNKRSIFDINIKINAPKNIDATDIESKEIDIKDNNQFDSNTAKQRY